MKSQVRFTALKEEQIKFCISVSVINANRVFLYYEDGRPLPGGIRTLRCLGPAVTSNCRDPGNQRRTYGSLWKLSLCSAVLCSYFVTTGYCSLAEECTDSSPLWVLLQLLTPGAGVISAACGVSDRTGQTLSLHGCAGS